MFTADYLIDQFQNGKKFFVKMMISNESMAKTMNNFIDNQTDYTKKVVSETSKMFSELTAENLKTMQSMMKFDMFKFSEELAKNFQTASSKKH